MKRIYHCYLYSLLLTLSCCMFSSCIREDIQGNSPEANFESLWKIIDEQYCFLDYKHEMYGLDWDEVHTRYAKRISSSMSWESLFEVLSEMVNELRDGHVNLSSSLGTSQYREWFDAYPRNFSDSIQSNYLKKDYIITSGLTYQILENNIGYIYCESFSDGTNDFVNTMRQFPNVTTMGDTTGGGSGLPFSSEIPNGWSIRFSASPMFDPDMNQLEFGIEPDVKVNMTSEDMQQGKDTIIETAIKKLKN